jgi:hypothetical protein
MVVKSKYIANSKSNRNLSELKTLLHGCTHKQGTMIFRVRESSFKNNGEKYIAFCFDLIAEANWTGPCEIRIKFIRYPDINLTAPTFIAT